MNKRKFQLIRTIVKLFRPSSQSAAFEQNLKAQIEAEAYYMTPMPRI